MDKGHGREVCGESQPILGRGWPTLPRSCWASPMVEGRARGEGQGTQWDSTLSARSLLSGGEVLANVFTFYFLLFPSFLDVFIMGKR